MEELLVPSSGYSNDRLNHSYDAAGSPFSVNVVNESMRGSSAGGGAGLGFVPVRRLSYFTINAQEAGDAPVNVTIKSPDGRDVACNVIPQGNYMYKVEWTPQVVGDHRVEIMYSQMPIGGSPFVARVYDASRVQVSHVTSGKLGKQCTFKVDASKAGAGNLEIVVSVRGENVPNYVSAEGNARFLVSFTPQIAETHRVSVRFNDEHVQGSPYTVDVIDTRNVSVHGDGLNTVRVNTIGSFTVDPHGPIAGELDARITSPSGVNVPASVELFDSNHYRVNFHPTEVGRHVIDVIYANEPVMGSPFYCEVFDSSRVKITDVTPDPKINQEVSFIVDASQAGAGDIDVEVLCNNNLVRSKREPLNTNRHRYSFYPSDFGDYVISATFNYQQVTGSPVRLRIGPDFHRYSAVGPTTLAANTAGQFTVATGGDSGQFDVSVIAPNGERLPASMVQSPAGDYKVDWKTPYVGRHTVDVKLSGEHISGSPYYVYVFDPSRVRIENVQKLCVGQECGFEINVGEAGKAQLDVTLYGPSGQSVPFGRSGNEFVERITFYPTEPGVYQAHVKYGNFDVAGSPFAIEVLGSANNIKAFGDGLFKGVEDKPATFYVDTQGGRGDLFVQVDGPNSLAKVNVEPENNLYRVNYVPVEVGLFDCVIKFNGQDIPGSPFHPKVVCPNKVRPAGGWQSILDGQDRLMLTVGEQKRMIFDCVEAGQGALKAEVEGPDGALVPCLVDPRGDGHVLVSFTPLIPGQYRLRLWWEGLLLANCPLVGVAGERVMQASREQLLGASPQDHTKVILMGRGLREAQVGETAEFYIDGSQAGPGGPRVELTGTRSDIAVQVLPQKEARYKCVYTPESTGAYLMNIFWNERQVKGSPFKVNVSTGPESNKVTVASDTFKMGMVDQELRTMIDTRKAGPGELTAECMGPTRVAFCELHDHHNGTFSLTVRPQEAGRHVLQVKYAGDHIPGSPFILRISGAPDAGKVKVYGPGVESGTLANFQSRFTVETGGAGAGQLTVRVRGPKGAFRVEMQRESHHDRTIQCRYDPHEVGEYTVHIKWSGEHVPGSPFRVRIVDTKEELNRMLNESGTGHRSMSYNQWNAEQTLY